MSWMVNKSELENEKLLAWRNSTKVSALQARIAIDECGLTTQVEDYLSGSVATNQDRIAWEYATEFRRNSVVLCEIATYLEISDTELDDIFRFALTVQV